MVTPNQVRAARALLRLEQGELARRSDVSVVTIRRLESDNGDAAVAPTTIARVQRALEEAGAEFIPQEGVRRRRRARTPEEKERLIRDLMEIADRAAALPAENPEFSENDLYDENGLPA